MDFAELRKSMVSGQLAGRGINNPRILEVFLKVERHKFVSQDLQDCAYSDCPLPIGEGQTISQPYMVALMTSCLNLSGSERVLEIGTGSGYQTAILAELAKEVYSIERLPSLSKNAESILKGLGYSNIKLAVGDGTLGWPEYAPFDRIIITAATPRVPLPLSEQLAKKAKMALPIGDTYSQVLTLIEEKEGTMESTRICGCVFVPLVGKYACQE